MDMDDKRRAAEADNAKLRAAMRAAIESLETEKATLMQIKNRYGDVMHETLAESLRDALIEAVTQRKNLRGADLSGADLRGIYLRGADLSGTYLRGAYLCSANLSGANLSGANLRDADISGADISGANLRVASLSGAYLCGADLIGADLIGAYLRVANLRGADLSGANLRGADLSGAYLRDANLCGADLHDTDLRDANLCYVDLVGAKLGGAYLCGAKINWNSHELIAEILKRAAGDGIQKRMIAGLILVSRDWCWKKFLALNGDLKPLREWALDELAKWVTNGDNAPEVLRDRADSLKKGT